MPLDLFRKKRNIRDYERAGTIYPEKGIGYLDFDLEKAKTYTRIKADYIAETFLEAIKRWEMMERWK